MTNNEGGRQIAMRVWIDPDRLAALNLAPGDVHAALQRNNYLAAVGQTKGNLVQVNLLANTDLRSVDEFANLIVADRDGAIVRLRDVARVELGAEEADLVAKYNESEGVYLGRLAAGRRERDRGRRTGCATRWSASARRCRRTSRCGWCGTARCSCATRSTEITQDAGRDDADRRPGGVPVHGLDPHRAGAAGRHAGLAGRRRRS